MEKIQRDIKDWMASGKKPVRIFANFSERGFSDNKFLAKLKQFVHNNRLITRYFDIELTEQVLLKAGEQSKQLLALLHENGISLVLDKFGMGYSSIRHLKDSPIDRIKIDKLFIDRAALDGHEAPYVNAIIAMSQSLNIKTVAVGIEEKQQRQFIEQTQCDIVQGFIYHKPMDAQSLKELLQPAD